MGLLIECPKCHYKGSLSKKACPQCGHKFGGGNEKIFWIDYRAYGKRRRERVGICKREAMDLLGKRRAQIREGRLWDKKKEFTQSFADCAREYIGSSKVKSYRAFKTERSRVRALEKFFCNVSINKITPSMIEDYKAYRLNSESYRGKKLTTTTVNRELSSLHRIFARLVDDEKFDRNPVKKVKKEKENDPRDRVLSKKEFESLVSAAENYLKPILMVAYGTGMRKQEILKLRSDRVDLKSGFIRLKIEDTKTREGRSIPLDKSLIQALRTVMLKGSKDHDYVFTRNGKPIKDIRKAFISACTKAKIEGFIFHDFRHTWITNKRREGHDYFKIMAASGHRAMEVFKRYNTVDESDLRTLVENGHQNGHQPPIMRLTPKPEQDINIENSIEIPQVGD